MPASSLTMLQPALRDVDIPVRNIRCPLFPSTIPVSNKIWHNARCNFSVLRDPDVR